MNKSIRNLVIFAVVTLTCGFAGIAIDRLSPPDDPMQGLGALIWLVSPLAASLLLRWLGGDGWGDFGLRPHIKDNWIWYLSALMIPLIVTLVVLLPGIFSGSISLSGFSDMGFAALVPLVLAGFGGAAVKNVFEEFAWRGYLTPRFEAIGLHPFANSILTGFIWAGWHVPYYLYFLDRTELQAHTSFSMPAFILLAFLVLPFHALAYGELRLISKSVWPVWLMHNVANAISLPLISAGFVVLRNDFWGDFLSPGTAGVLYSLVMGVIGLGLYQYRRRKSAR